MFHVKHSRAPSPKRLGAFFFSACRFFFDRLKSPWHSLSMSNAAKTVKTFKFTSDEGRMRGALLTVVEPVGDGQCLVRFIGRQPKWPEYPGRPGLHLVNANEVEPV